MTETDNKQEQQPKRYYMAFGSFIFSILGVFAYFGFGYLPFKFLGKLIGEDNAGIALVCTCYFGLFILLVAPVLGITSLVKIIRSKGGLKGKRFAITAIMICLIFYIWIFYMMARLMFDPM